METRNIEALLLAPLVALVAAGSLSSQDPLDVRRIEVPRAEADSRLLHAVDMTGDGSVDLVVGNQPPFGGGRWPAREHGPWVWAQTSPGRFASRITGVPVQFTSPLLAVHDLDGDGDQDLLLAAAMGLNDGAGTLVWHPLNVYLRGERGVVVDLDGDGLEDVFTGERVYLRQGPFAFLDDTAARIPTSVLGSTVTGIASADIDGDGDLDFALARSLAQNVFVLDDGTGHFVDGTAGRLTAEAADTRDLAFADFDGDGDLDLVTADFVTGADLYYNDGSGVFQKNSTAIAILADGTALAVGDIDGDGDRDVVLGTADGGLVLRNNGAGRMAAEPGSWAPNEAPTGALILCEVDGDGDLDLVQGCGGSRGAEDPLTGPFGIDNRLWFNDGAGRFSGPSGETLHPGVAHEDVAAGDLDGDGDVDLLATRDGGQLLSNDGWGVWQESELTLPVGGRPALGDLDGDGDLDALLLEQVGALHVLVNPGDGRVWPQRSVWLPPLQTGVAPRDLALGDFDGDGDLDVVVVTARLEGNLFPPPPPTPMLLYANDGAGLFSDASSRLPPHTYFQSERVAAADFDSDGDVDIATTSGIVLRNDGNGFTHLPQAWAYGEAWVARLAPGDLDGDGDLDLAFGLGCRGIGCAPSGNAPADVVRWNDGQGGFDAATVLTGTDLTHTRAVAVGDVDGDGDLDVILGNVSGNGSPENQLVRNLGGGAFAAAEPLAGGWNETVGLHAADFDSDGDHDIAVINAAVDRSGSGRSQLLLGGTRHVWAPFAMASGRSYTVAVIGGRRGAWLFASLAPSFLPLPPFGVMGLDGGTRVCVAVLNPAAPPTSARFTTTVPALRALVGIEVFWQAVVLDGGPAGTRLTNTLRDRITAR